jgi:hypothetical protein
MFTLIFGLNLCLLYTFLCFFVSALFRLLICFIALLVFCTVQHLEIFTIYMIVSSTLSALRFPRPTSQLPPTPFLIV